MILCHNSDLSCEQFVDNLVCVALYYVEYLKPGTPSDWCMQGLSLSEISLVEQAPYAMKGDATIC